MNSSLHMQIPAKPLLPVFLILMLVFQTCSLDHFNLIPEELAPNHYGVDAAQKIILYNGTDAVINDMTLVIGDEVFQLNEKIDSLEKNRAYELSFNEEDYLFYITDLPIIVIHSDKLTIKDSPKIGADLWLLEKDKTTIETSIGIELGGHTSQTYPKKTYDIELRWSKEEELSRKLALLNMREDDDWILDGMWNEPLRIRDYFGHELWLSMGRIANQNSDKKVGIDRRYVELFLNGEYRGVYYLGEKIDRKQLGIEDYESGSWGELFKAKFWSDEVTYDAYSNYYDSRDRWGGYEIRYPDVSGYYTWERLYEWVKFVVDSDQDQFNEAYLQYLDVDNAVDYFLFLNVIFGSDNYGKNIYTGRLHETSPFFFVPWDMDAILGRNYKTEKIDDSEEILSNGLFDKLIANPLFRQKLKNRWNSLKVGPLELASMQDKLSDLYSLLNTNGVYLREDLDGDLSENFEQDEIIYLQNWLESRWIFMNAYISGL